MNPRGKVDEVVEGRSVPRTGLFLSALLHSASGSRTVRIRNLSPSGALIESEAPLPVGTPVCLERSGNSAQASIRWNDGERSGLQFTDPIAMELWVPTALAQRQMALDRKIATIRKDLNLAETEVEAKPVLQNRIASELEFAARNINACLDDLATFAPVVMRHPKALQELEITAQILGHLAKLLTARDPAAHLATLGMEELKRRLTRS